MRSGVVTTVQEFLSEHFPFILPELEAIADRRFGVAYRHYRWMSLLSSVFKSVGLDIHSPSQTGTIYLADGIPTSLDYNQIFNWAGIKSGNFRNYKTNILDAEKVRCHLETQSLNGVPLSSHAQQSLFDLQVLAGCCKSTGEYKEQNPDTCPPCLKWSIKDLKFNILDRYQS
jgi:hypothetical protein